MNYPAHKQQVPERADVTTTQAYYRTSNPLVSDLAIYIHYPFCKSKCPYCDFNSHVSNQIDHKRFTASYLTELEYFRNITKNRNITSIFFGGGTPSLMPINTINKILEKIHDLWNVENNVEITLEANPTSSESAKFSNIKAAGINRLSIGVQAFNDYDLKFLGREHSTQAALETIEIAKKIFQNFSFDLIYARPKQTVKSWQKELEQALAINSPHLSLYQLTIEKGTPFYNSYKTQKFTLPNQDLQNDLYDLTNETCHKYGLENYEISNYSKPDLHSKHNLNYWNYGDYLGIGAGSHSRLTIADSNNQLQKKSLMNYHLPQKWLDNITHKKHAIQNSKTLTKSDIFTETILMGLRTKFGIETEKIYNNLSKADADKFLEKVNHLSTENLLQLSTNSNNKQYIHTSYQGSKLLNSVCNYLLT